MSDWKIVFYGVLGLFAYLDVFAQGPEISSRPFRMGFTAFPHDATAEALKQTRQFVWRQYFERSLEQSLTGPIHD